MPWLLPTRPSLAGSELQPREQPSTVQITCHDVMSAWLRPCLSQKICLEWLRYDKKVFSSLCGKLKRGQGDLLSWISPAGAAQFGDLGLSGFMRKLVADHTARDVVSQQSRGLFRPGLPVKSTKSHNDDPNWVGHMMCDRALTKIDLLVKVWDGLAASGQARQVQMEQAAGGPAICQRSQTSHSCWPRRCRGRIRPMMPSECSISPYAWRDFTACMSLLLDHLEACSLKCPKLPKQHL